jgi:hypothetical protein
MKRIARGAFFVLLGLGFTGLPAHADVIKTFTQIENDTLDVFAHGATGVCQDTDTGHITYDLVLDQGDIDDFNNALAQGGRVILSFTTHSSASTLGDGWAEYGWKIRFQVFSATLGRKRNLERWRETTATPPDFVLLTEYTRDLTQSEASQLQAGDGFRVRLDGRARADVGGCTLSDQAILFSHIDGGGAPQFYVDFPPLQ